MAGEAPVAYFVTGFGPFQDVPSNPTERLVANLTNEEASASTRVHLQSTLVVDVDVEGAETAVRALCARVREAELASRRSVLIHLGVDTSLTEYHLERTAFNEKTFRVPDASGYQPTGLPICAEDGGLGCFLRTTIPVDDVVTRLRELGHPCAASDDAGRYLCNYIYYASLRSAARCTAEGVSCASLFVHVPPFAVIDEATQTAFVRDLLRVVAEAG